MWQRIVEGFHTNWDSYLWFRICVIGASIGVTLAVLRKVLFGSWWTFVKARLRPPEAVQRKRDIALGEKSLKAKEYEAAAEAFIRAEMFDPAIAAYAQGKLWIQAAELAAARGRKRDAATFYLSAGQEEKAAQLFAEVEDYDAAVDAFQRAGKPLLIAQMFERAGKFRESADWYLKIGFLRQAAEAYAKADRPVEAAPLFEKLWREAGGGSSRILSDREQAEVRRLGERGAQLFVGAGQPERAVELLERSGRAAEAADVAEKAGLFERAGGLHRTAKRFDRAQACFAQAGRTKEAGLMEAEHLQAQGRTAEAAARFEANGAFQRAAELYGSTPDGAAKAAAMYERLNQHIEAAHWYCKAGDLRKGAAGYEANQEYVLAERIYHQLNDADSLLRIALKRENWLLAGRAQLQRGAVDEAIRLLQQIPRAHDDYGSACAELARAFRARGSLAQAAIKFEEYARFDPIDRANLGVYYEFARCLEDQGKAERALDVYNQILARDIAHADVQARAEALEKRTTVRE